MKISIVIPAKNEEQYIEKCLHSILQCGYDHGLLEVFVCDGKSTDATGVIVSEYAEKHSFIRLLINEEEFTPQALNIGIRASTSELVMILGAHAELAKGFLTHIVEVFKKYPEVGCAGGHIENIAESPFARAVNAGMSSIFGVGNAHFRTGTKEGFVDTVAFGVFRREVFDKVGYFDEDLIRNQDDEFSFRLIKNGYKIYLSNHPAAKYYVRAKASKLFKQYFQYGYWKVYVNRKHKTITTLRQLIPAFFVAFLILGLIGSLLSSLLLWISCAIFALYIAFAIIASISKRRTCESFHRTILVFLILHVAYGTGYIKGLFDFMVFNYSPNSKMTQGTR